MKMKTPVLPGTKITADLVLNDALLRARDGEIEAVVVLAMLKDRGVATICSDISSDDLIRLRYMGDVHMVRLIESSMREYNGNS